MIASLNDAPGLRIARHRVLKPDQALAPLVGLGLVTHGAEPKRPGEGLEGVGGDGDTDDQAPVRRRSITLSEGGGMTNCAQWIIIGRRNSSRLLRS